MRRKAQKEMEEKIQNLYVVQANLENKIMDLKEYIEHLTKARKKYPKGFCCDCYEHAYNQGHLNEFIHKKKRFVFFVLKKKDTKMPLYFCPFCGKKLYVEAK